MLKRTVIFLIINFGALALGSMFTTSGVTSEWYEGLIKAPWTPPGWVFGAAWTLIMICFSIFMAKLWDYKNEIKNLAFLFGIQFILNVMWNPVFFKFKAVGLGLVVISSLTILVAVFQFGFVKKVRSWSLLVTPYLIWLCIATSLNAYILFCN